MCNSLSRVIGSLLIGSIALVLALEVNAAEFPNAFSLQGYTGIMNTPTANVQQEGSMAFWYGKQKEYINNSLTYYNRDNYFFSFGMFSILEAGGRLAAGVSDLSAQFKVTTAPFTPKQYSWLPSLAFGMQDMAGSSNNFQTKYIVATEEISRFRLSLGYGFGSTRMDGIFGGGEIRAFDWLYLLGEYDTKDTNVGVRVITPDLFGFPVNLQSTFKSAVNKNPGTIDFTIGVQFSLGKDWRSLQKSVIPSNFPPETPPTPASAAALPDTKPIAADAAVVAAAGPAPVAPEPDADDQPLKAGAEVIAAEPSTRSPAVSSLPGAQPVMAGLDAAPGGAEIVAANMTESLCNLRDKLVDDGFMHVKVGANNAGLLVVEYENARYNHSQLDAMGVVLGMVVKYAPKEFKTVRLVVKVQDLRMIQVAVPIEILRAFFRDPSMNLAFSDLADVSYAIAGEQDVTFVKEASFSSWFRSRLVLAPRLVTFVGNEYGNFNYLLSFAPSLYVDLWKGAILKTGANIPFSWSKGFDDGELYRNYRTDPQLEYLSVFQAFKPHPDWMISIGGGMVSHDIYGTLNDIYWYSKDGSHRLGFQQGFGKGNGSSFNHTAYLGSYRYTYTPLDTSLTVTGGSFWYNDTGVRFDLARYFGDTALSFFYKFSRTTNDQNYQLGGLQLSFPLTPRQGMKPYPVQVKGSDNWTYYLETVTDSPDGRNTVGLPLGFDPPALNSIPSVYYDRDRLTPEYIKTHLLRVRDAYLRYGAAE